MHEMKPILETILALSRVLQEARAAQWEAPPHPMDDSGISSGKVPDPTANVATDVQRLRLRAAVMAAERILEETTHHMAAEALEPLQKALDQWHGEL